MQIRENNSRSMKIKLKKLKQPNWKLWKNFPELFPVLKQWSKRLTLWWGTD